MMSDDAWAACKIAIAVFGYMFGGTWLVALLATSSVERTCQAYGELTGYEVEVISGYMCMINDPDEGWMRAYYEQA